MNTSSTFGDQLWTDDWGFGDPEKTQEVIADFTEPPPKLYYEGRSRRSPLRDWLCYWVLPFWPVGLVAVVIAVVVLGIWVYSGANYSPINNETYPVTKDGDAFSFKKICSEDDWWPHGRCEQLLAEANPQVNPNKIPVGTVLLIPGRKLTAKFDAQAKTDALRCEPQQLGQTGYELTGACAAKPTSSDATTLPFRIPITPIGGKLACENYYVTRTSPPGNPPGFTKLANGGMQYCGNPH